MCSVMLGCLKWSKKIKWCIHIILKKFVILIRGTTPFSSILLWKSSKKDDNFITTRGRYFAWYFLELLIWSLLVYKTRKRHVLQSWKSRWTASMPFCSSAWKIAVDKAQKNRASIWNDIEIGWTWINDNIKIDKYIYIYININRDVKVYWAWACSEGISHRLSKPKCSNLSKMPIETKT